MTKIAKTATVGVVVVAFAAILLAYSAMILPAYAQATTAPSSASQTSNQANPNQRPGPWAASQRRSTAQHLWGTGFGQRQANLSLGQTITVTSAQGEYRVVGSPSTNGTASGTVTFTVTGKLARGYTLSLTDGSLTVAGTTYTIASGSAQMNPAGTAISGQGTTSPVGQFIVRAIAHGTFSGSNGLVSLDFANGTAEYMITLTGSIQG